MRADTGVDDVRRVPDARPATTEASPPSASGLGLGEVTRDLLTRIAQVPRFVLGPEPALPPALVAGLAPVLIALLGSYLLLQRIVQEGPLPMAPDRSHPEDHVRIDL